MITLNKNFFNRQGTRPGALSPCILGKGASANEDFNVLPNCVGFSVGYYNQLHGQTYCRYFGSYDATYFYDLGISQGLRGDTSVNADIVPGSLLCWGGYGSHTQGHCAIVESVVSPTHIKCNESGWNFGVKYRTNVDYYLRNGCWENNWLTVNNGYFFKGIIYPPGYNPNPPHPPSTIETKHFNWLLVTKKKRSKLSRY